MSAKGVPSGSGFQSGVSNGRAKDRAARSSGLGGAYSYHSVKFLHQPSAHLGLRRRLAAPHHVFGDAVVREMIMGENYERNITLIRSDISRFSRGTITCGIVFQ
jgi:hypothetical protein